LQTSHWTLSMLRSEEVDTGEIALFLVLRNIKTVLDYILTNMEGLQNHQFFSETTILHLKRLHQTLWTEKYQLSVLEYNLIARLIDKRSITLSELTKFLKENQPTTPLVAGWMHQLIRKLHQNDQRFITTYPHPSGSEYCWEPTGKEWHA